MRTPAYSAWSSIIDLPAKEAPMTPNIHDIIRDHVTLSIRCLDRLYLHAYMPKLQTSGGLVLLPPRSSWASDSVARPVRADARPVRRAIKTYVAPARAFRSSRSSGASAKTTWSPTIARASPAATGVVVHRRGAREDAGVQGAQTVGPRRAASPSTSRGSRSPSITTTSTSRTANGARRS